ncbi:hypothetical protein [Psychrosphaera haliotis]|uniref:Uncharacterized protein n=1 Tax=Psychrosphaera haliotis TaxID=555083 RepID=A0A6N8F356_9GAMM|nr:hypothetical protein [Psychrosphaera haliotis]MUH71045.1 hypothetical protein [Psychrosphaera haliotis]
MAIHPPTILCGPFLRLVDKHQANIWFVADGLHDYQLEVMALSNKVDIQQALDFVQLGEKCFAYLINIRPMAEHWALSTEHSYTILNNIPTAKPSSDVLGHFKVNETISSVIQGFLS